MSIQISGHQIEVTPGLRELINSKCSELQRDFDGVTSIRVVLSVTKLSQNAEAILHVPGAEIFAKAESEDMYVTIEMLVNKLVRQLEKHKEKQNNC